MVRFGGGAGVAIMDEKCLKDRRQGNPARRTRPSVRAGQKSPLSIRRLERTSAAPRQAGILEPLTGSPHITCQIGRARRARPVGVATRAPQSRYHRTLKCPEYLRFQV